MAIAPDHPLSAELAAQRSRARRLHRRMRPPRHQRGGDRAGREAGLRHRPALPQPAGREPGAAGLRRQLRADGVRHRRDLRLPGARPARPRVRAQVRPAGAAGGPAAGRGPEDLRDRRRGLCRRRPADQFRLPRRARRRGRQAAGDRAASRRRASAAGEVTYRLRDWGVSRQRYWGCPIPVIHCGACGIVPVPREQLPVTLPEDVELDQPGNPLEHHPTWKHVTCPNCGGPARARDRHLRHLRRELLVFPPLLLAARRRRLRPRGGRPLDAGRPVHRRRRARGPAPALFALLHPRPQALRLSRRSTSRSPACSPRAWSATRPSATQAGNWLEPDEVAEVEPGVWRAQRRRPAGDRRPLREDEQVAPQHHRSDRDHRGLRRRHRAPVHAVRQPARARPGVDRGRHRRRLALSQPPLAPGRGPARAARAERRAARRSRCRRRRPS